MTAKFGTLLRKAREEAHWGMGDLAQHLEVSLTYLSDVERDRRPPLAADRILKAAAALEVEPDTLLRAAAESRGVFELEAKNVSKRKKDLGASLMRGWNDLTEDQLRGIEAVLGKEKK